MMQCLAWDEVPCNLAPRGNKKAASRQGKRLDLASGEGIEPSLAGLEAAALPLN